MINNYFQFGKRFRILYALICFLYNIDRFYLTGNLCIESTNVFTKIRTWKKYFVLLHYRKWLHSRKTTNVLIVKNNLQLNLKNMHLDKEMRDLR